MRWLMIVCIAPLACITVDGDRRFVSEKLRGDCGPMTPRVSVDEAERARVKLLFENASVCTDVRTYDVEQKSKLNDNARVGFGVGAGLAAVAAVTLPVTLSISSDEYFHPKPENHNAQEYRTLGVVAGSLAAGIVVGWLTYWLLGFPSTPLPEKRVIERGNPNPNWAIDVATGVVAGAGLSPPRELTAAGVLELTLDDGLDVVASPLTLNGTNVTLSTPTLEKLSALSDCRTAVRYQKWNNAERCAAQGWGFADAVLAAPSPK